MEIKNKIRQLLIIPLTAHKPELKVICKPFTLWVPSPYLWKWLHFETLALTAITHTHTHMQTPCTIWPCSTAELSSIILTKSIWIPQLIPGRRPNDIYSPPRWWKSTVNLFWLPALGQVTLLVLSPSLTHITTGNSHAPFFEVSI